MDVTLRGEILLWLLLKTEKRVIFTKTRVWKLSEMIQDKSKNIKTLLSNAQNSFSETLGSF